ncbi:MAG: D-alanyl-D-alanine carboxypeptidase [Clostridia bacterium]|nr:D-alanyl-D-alanine carboxypeptidase [Clostridia bacterium]
MKKIICVLIIVFLMLANNSEIYAESKLQLNAKNAILYDRKCKRILYEKNAFDRVPNASTTKILTAIVVVENCDVNEIVEIGQNAINVIGSKVKFRRGDKITVNDLLNGMLLCSGNDAAIALAEHVSGSVEQFCILMNQKAKKIGAKNTNFLSPHGLDTENHYSTAYDLAIIADYALSNKYLANIFSKKTETIYINQIARNISTTNEMLHVYPTANGVKTGFTNNAGRCLVTSATNNDEWQLISVVLGCDTKNFRTQDSQKLLNYGFQNFKLVNIGEVLPKKVLFEVNKSVEEIFKIDINYYYEYPLTEEEIKNLHYKEYKTLLFEAPVKENTEIVRYEIYSRRNENN